MDARTVAGCRHRLRMDIQHGELVAGPESDLGVRQRRAAAASYRAAVRDWLVTASWAVIDPALPVSQREARTLAAITGNTPRIWGATLPAQAGSGRRGGAEILWYDAENGGYFPVIVVNHKVADRRQPEPHDAPALTTELTEWAPAPDLHYKLRVQFRDQLRLAHLYRMLQGIEAASPAAQGGIIGANFDPAHDRMLVLDLAAVLGEYDQRYADRIAVARGELPTVPSRVSECRSCPWWAQSCHSWLAQQHDVSLVAPGPRAQLLRQLGVTTIDGLAGWPGGEPADWQYGDFGDVVVTARAWLADIPLVRRVPQVRVQRADVEVDVDLESYQEDGAYLWGTLLNGEYRPFITWDPLPTADEGRAFGEFWTWLMQVRAEAAASGKTFAAYCYSRNSEDKWMYSSARRFAGMAGVPTVGQVREFVDGGQWVDMFEAVNDQFICPHGKGLKKVAPVAGFAWRDPEASGEASMSWYREAVGYDGEPDMGERQRLFEYNEDDVRATMTLRNWMTTHANQQVPLAAEL